MESSRRCTRCCESRPAAEFRLRAGSKKTWDVLCRSCRSAYGKEHYAVNRQRYIDQAHARKRALALERTRYLLSYFAAHPCVACGEADPVVLEFDHLGDKSFNIGRSLADRNWASILAEIEKCEVVCANCHRRRTASRRGSLRSVLTLRSRTD